MYLVVSPAKKLAPINRPFLGRTSQPMFHELTDVLIELMRTKSVADLMKLMDISHDLASLNYERYQHFHTKKSPDAYSYPALFLFQGDVYQGLQASSLTQQEIDYAQEHLGILSGLYGLLRPLDAMQPYRLEMGTRLDNPAGNSLYAFWQELVTQQLNAILASQENPLLVNLASTEYFKVINVTQLNYPVLTINFYERKNDELKMIGIHAKKARGLMARFIVQHRIEKPEQIQEFKEQGYVFHEPTSSEHHLEFVRG